MRFRVFLALNCEWNHVVICLKDQMNSNTSNNPIIKIKIIYAMQHIFLYLFPKVIEDVCLIRIITSK